MKGFVNLSTYQDPLGTGHPDVGAKWSGDNPGKIPSLGAESDQNRWEGVTGGRA